MTGGVCVCACVWREGAQDAGGTVVNVKSTKQQVLVTQYRNAIPYFQKATELTYTKTKDFIGWGVVWGYNFK